MTVKRVTITPDGAAHPSLRCLHKWSLCDNPFGGASSDGRRVQTAIRTLGEAGMRHISISGRHGARHRYTIAAALWVLVGIVAVIAFGDTLTLLAVALAIVMTAWWICRGVEHRVKINDPQLYVTGVGSRAGQ
jgi:hypothetical protein